MRLRSFILGVVILLVVLAAAPAWPLDVIGWERVKWGMTQPEVMLEYPLRDWEKGMPPRVCAQDILFIQGEQFSVWFYFDQQGPDGKLIKVALRSLRERADYSFLATLLAEKYGRPDRTGKTAANYTEYVWRRPSGSIRLSLSDRSTHIRQCEVEYSATERQAPHL